ncbi:hypothetical protein WKK05_18045 [Nostoc sp. UHCC 0302]|uniref:hypothetical protein n=1 Tax=Nostoc sp. UHCC 0302 TaxID=3134896 RepID=UPI00311CBF00
MNKREISLTTISIFLGALTFGVSLDRNVKDFWKILIPGLGSIGCGLVLSIVKPTESEFEKQCNERIARLTQWEDSLILLESQLNQNIEAVEVVKSKFELEHTKSIQELEKKHLSLQYLYESEFSHLVESRKQFEQQNEIFRQQIVLEAMQEFEAKENKFHHKDLELAKREKALNFWFEDRKEILERTKVNIEAEYQEKSNQLFEHKDNLQMRHEIEVQSHKEKIARLKLELQDASELLRFNKSEVFQNSKQQLQNHRNMENRD